MKTDHRRDSRKGFALVMTGVCSIAMLGMLGMAVDLGRMYVVKNEIQAYTDSAALSAGLELDGTLAGFTRARDAVTADGNRWNFSTTAFTGTQTDFATDAAGPWDASPATGPDYRFVRVRANSNLRLYFLPVVAAPDNSTLRAVAVAGQLEKEHFTEGLFPFSPIAHGATPVAPDFGFTPGGHYALRWGVNVAVKSCTGDKTDPAWVARADAGSASDRGYIEESSASAIREAIEQNAQTRPLEVGDTVLMTSGNKETERESVWRRAGGDQSLVGIADTDPDSTSYAEYLARGTGNGRRLVAVPINSGEPSHTILGIRAFFLLAPAEYGGSGQDEICAEYVGPYVEGSRQKGGGTAGAYAVRLVR